MRPLTPLFKEAILDPCQFAFQMVGKCKPDWIFQYYSNKARKQGFNKLYIILSFDCDTPEDIPAAEKIHAYLSERGIKATYAVPGHILKAGKDVFQDLSEHGADFINHGALPHAEKREGHYWPVTFYNKLPLSEVIDDIHQGHKIVTDVIGHPPIGFRAPHFGCVQNSYILKKIHHILRELGYLYSTSTIPFFGFRYGPIWKVNGIYEFPTSGSYNYPFKILDSWSHIISPSQPCVRDEYAYQFIDTIKKLKIINATGILNYYIDPAHVVSSMSFYNALDFLIAKGIPTLYYDEAIKIMGGS
jgi:hypothetical protein